MPSSDNVQETNQTQANLEYKLATGNLDKPKGLTLSNSNTALLIVEMRDKSLDVYNELIYIPCRRII